MICTVSILHTAYSIYWRTQWQPTPVLLPGKSHGWRSLVGCSPLGRWVGYDWVTSLSLFTFMHWRKKWQLTPVFLLGEPQRLENLRDRGTWWAAVYGVTQSRTRLKRLSSNSSIVYIGFPGSASGKEPACQSRRHKRHRFDPWVRNIPWRRAWQPTPAFSPRESPWTEEPGWLQFIGSQRVRHHWSNLAHTHTVCICQSQSPNSLYLISPLGIHTFVCVSIPAR